MNNKKKEYSRAEFIGRARANCGFNYNYSKVNYSLTGMISADKEIFIICPKHGEFTQKVSQHLNGNRYSCKSCYKEKFPNAKTIFSMGFHKMGDKVVRSEKWSHNQKRKPSTGNPNLKKI